ncbi:DUF3265 domain-containing protein [Vibrio sp. 03-59-1]|nr:DUF3265 domain-containing protein [Vibrio sp. 03-59-1]
MQPDLQRVAFLLLIRFSDYGTMQNHSIALLRKLIGRYIA